MSIKDMYEIKPITYREAMEVVVKNHYLHRKAPCSYSFGLFEKITNRLVGVIIYGKPASPALCKGLCGKEESTNVMELTRLWTEDGLPTNTESYLIGNTIPLVKEEILVSYAEIRVGHIGIVYQATNWIYTGKSDKHIKWLVQGCDNKHSRHLFDQYGGINNAKKILGDQMVKVERPRKHRYVYINTKNKKRRKELLGKLKYRILPYPKKEALINAKR